MDDSIDIECIEDIDVYNDGHLTAINANTMRVQIITTPSYQSL